MTSKNAQDHKFRAQWRLREKVYNQIQINTSENHTVPRFEQLREGLRKLIVEGKLLSGDVLMPRHHMCESLGVNRVIINQAIRDLISEGLLRSEHGRGVFVNSISPKRVGLVTLISRSALFKKPLVSYPLMAYWAIQMLNKANVQVDILSRERPGKGLRFGPPLEKVLAANVDAYMPLGIQNEEYLFRLIQTGKPVVGLDVSPTISEFDGVVFDTFRAGYLATRYLLENGHRRIQT